MFGIGGIGGFFLNGAADGMFSGGGMGLVPDNQASAMGANGGNQLVNMVAGTPLAMLPSPANMDPAVTLFGMKEGPLAKLGGFIEDTSQYQKYVGGIAGGIIGAMLFGQAKLGWRMGWTAGVTGGATMDATSDAGIGIFDLDGKESKGQGQMPVFNFWPA